MFTNPLLAVKRNGTVSNKILLAVVLIISFSSTLSAQDEYSDHSYFYEREYYALRSGRAKMIIQSDKTGQSPAFSYLLFDAKNPAQTLRKNRAYNYNDENLYFSSALEVLMNNYAFTSLGQTTNTQWVNYNGIPSAFADWWASGIKVEETITPLANSGIFLRNITLTAQDLMADDTAYIRLSIPKEANYHGAGIMLYEKDRAILGIKVVSNYPVKAVNNKQLVIGPIVLKPQKSISLKSYIIANIPASSAEETITKLNNAEEARLIEASANTWKQSNTISTSDGLLQNIFDAARYGLPSYVAQNGTMDAGVFEYGAQWVRDASNTSLGMTHIGEFELTRAMLVHMLENMIKDEGVTMISGGFDEPDREQFDQMGEFIHAMKSYVDWSGDVSLLKQYRKKILAMIERPLHKNFRDETGMVHNRREFWERTFDDAYELAYQMWIVTGLRDAADLAQHLDAEDRVDVWRKEADIIQNAMLNHPTAKLIDDGHLIKRRNINKEIVDIFPYGGWVAGAPAVVERMNGIYPDATMALPIAMGLVNGDSEIAQNTITELEQLWNRRWSFGGYERYNSSSQGDQPGPWTFATTFIMRGQHEARRHDLSRRSLEWLYNYAGGRTGAYYEHIPILRKAMETSGILPWTSAEVTYFVIHHVLGVKFKGNQLTIKPNLYKETGGIKADLRFRDSQIKLEITGSGKVSYALVNGVKVKPDKDGTILIPKNFSGGKIKITTN